MGEWGFLYQWVIPHLEDFDGGLVDGHNNGAASVSDITDHSDNNGCSPEKDNLYALR